MSDQEFNILHQDLSARIGYDVIVDYNGDRVMIDTVSKFGEVQPEGCNYTVSVEEVKPYLYPHDMMSSDPKLREEFSAMVRKEGLHFDNVTNFYNSHHIDYRDMIKKGLAIKITNENNPYKK